MSSLFELAMPWWEFVVRAAVIYVALLVMLRMSGKRTVGQFTPFDLMVLVVLGSAVEGSLIGEDVSLTGGLILATTLIACNWLVGFATARSPRFARLVEGGPVHLCRNGEVLPAVLRKQNLSRSDIDEALRDNGLTHPSQAELIVLEIDGTITVVPREGAKG